jgi:hypothetical protein
MDGKRFDAIARLMAETKSRRRILRVTAGGILGGIAGGLGLSSAQARPGNTQCSDDHCGQRKEPCCDGLECCHGRCLPPAHFLQDPHNCGACGAVCPKGAICTKGACLCAKGLSLCDGRCRHDNYFSNSQNNCSTCGNVCPVGTTCHKGACQPVTCPDGRLCAGDVTCHSFDNTYTTAGTCCAAPQRALCCLDSYPGRDDGFARCCTDGVDCECPHPNPGSAFSGVSLDCCDPAVVSAEPDRCQIHGAPPVGDQCCTVGQGGGATVGVTGINSGDPCHPKWPCDAGYCNDGICGCGAVGAPCGDETQHCCSGHCDPDAHLCSA